MQTYKVTTLGETFVFINRGMAEENVKIPPNIDFGHGGCHIVEITPDLKYDYRILTKHKAGVFAPDLFRALLIFLCRGKGLPASEYEIVVDGAPKLLKAESCDFGGNIGKCKLLFSKCSQNGDECDLVFYFIEAPQGDYVFTVCDNVDFVDMRMITSRAVSECGAAPPLRGVAAISYSTGNANFRFCSFDHSATVTTSVFAAASLLLFELFGSRECVISAGELKARCCTDASGARVYDLSPALQKIF